MSSRPTLIVGVAASAPAVMTIWQGMRDFFADGPVAIDWVLYSNYPRLTGALLDGAVDVAWQLNLAWVQTVRRSGGCARALSMRDTDIGFTTVLVAKPGSDITGPADLAGRRVALGPPESAQTSILPLHFLDGAGFDIVRAHSSDTDPHGEAAAVDAVLRGDADAAAVGRRHWEQLAASVDSSPAASSVEVVWTSPGYSHCVFAALDRLPAETGAGFAAHLRTMDYDNPQHRPLMDLEWVNRWVDPDLDGYASLHTAVEKQDIPLEW